MKSVTSTSLIGAITVAFIIFTSCVFASEEKRISLEVSQTGTVIVSVTEGSIANSSATIPRDYSIKSSPDLLNWEEITRISSLDSAFQFWDTNTQKKSNRFYKIELVALDSTTLHAVAAFVEELDAYFEYSNGILLEGVSLNDVVALREREAILREQLQALISQNQEIPTGLLELYYELLAETDQTLASNPLEITIGDVILEIEISEIMRIISEEYQRLDGVLLNDFDRLPGISSEDLQNLETLAEHLQARQIDQQSSIRVFDTFSPFGMYTLIDRLIRKNAINLLDKTKDNDNDGKREIDYGLFRKFINGIEPTTREASSLVNSLIEQNPIPWSKIDGNTITKANLKEVLLKVSTLDQILQSEVETLIKNKQFDPVFEIIVLNYISSQILNDEYRNFVSILSSHIREPHISIDFLTKPILPPLVNNPDTNDLSSYYNALKEWNEPLRMSMVDFLNETPISDKVSDDFTRLIEDKFNGYYANSRKVTGIYEAQFNQLTNALSYGNIRFNLSNGESVNINIHEHRILNALSFNIAALIQHSGIINSISEEELLSLNSNQDWYHLSRVSFSEQTEHTSHSLSLYGRNIELFSLLLNRYQDQVITNGLFDSNAVSRAILSEPELVHILDDVDQGIDEEIIRINDLFALPKSGLSKTDFETLINTLTTTKTSIQNSYSSISDTLDPHIQNSFTNALQSSYDKLNQKVDLILANPLATKLEIPIGQSTYSVFTQEAYEILLSQLDRIAVVDRDQSATGRQYSRLNGVSEESILALLQKGSRENLRNVLSYYPNNENNASLDQFVGLLELRHSLLPGIIEGFGQSIVNQDNSIDLNRFKAKLLENLYIPVPDGHSIKNRHIQLVIEQAQIAQSKLQNLSLGTWNNRLRAEAIYESMISELLSLVSPLINELDSREIQLLENDFSSQYLPRALYRNYITPVSNSLSLTMPDGHSFQVPLDEIRRIPRLPYYSTGWEKELFVGISDLDIEKSINIAQRPLYSKSEAFEENGIYQSINIDKLIVNLLIRYYTESDLDSAEYRTDLFQENKVSVEVFRRIIKGIDALHKAANAQARTRTNETVNRIEQLAKTPLTQESLLTVYQATVKLKSDLHEYLQTFSFRHEQADIVEMEESITAIYKSAIDAMIDYIRNNPLIIEREGKTLEVPVAELTQKLTELVSSYYPGEEIGTHHFAAIAGISVEDLRSYNTLEAFLGNQIIALPRNSQYVEITSKLSDIGYRQLAANIILRHFDEVVDPIDNSIDIETLLERLTDSQHALSRVETLVHEVQSEAIAKLNEITYPHSAQGLHEAYDLTKTFKEKMARRTNDYISYFQDEQIELVQRQIDDAFQAFVAQRDTQLVGSTIQIETIDHQSISVNLSAIEAQVAARIEELHQANPDSNELVETTIGRGLEIDTYWQPLPAYDPESTLTQLGFHILMIRLIENYGITVIENGNFSVTNFLEELGNANNTRFDRIFESLQAGAIRKLDDLLPEETTAIHHERVLSINTFLNEERQRFIRALKLGQGSNWNPAINEVANNAWLAVVDYYEQALFDRNIIAVIDGKEVEIPVNELVLLMDETYQDGYTNLLDSYLTDGESTYQYDSFKTLYQYYNDYSPSGTPFTAPISIEILDPLYPFNLGQLSRVPGISSEDLFDLETEQYHQIVIERIPAKELLKSQFNLRILSPGNSLQGIGLESSRSDFAGGDFIVGWPLMSYSDLSQRDKRFRLLIELIKDYIDVLITPENTIDVEAFRILIEEG